MTHAQIRHYLNRRKLTETKLVCTPLNAGVRVWKTTGAVVKSIAEARAELLLANRLRKRHGDDSDKAIRRAAEYAVARDSR